MKWRQKKEYMHMYYRKGRSGKLNNQNSDDNTIEKVILPQ